MVNEFSIKASEKYFKERGLEIVDYFNTNSTHDNRDIDHYFKVKFEDFYFYIGLRTENDSDFSIEDLYRLHISNLIRNLTADNIKIHYLKLLIENQLSFKHYLNKKECTGYKMIAMNDFAWKMVNKYGNLKDFCKDIDNIKINISELFGTN